MDSHLGAQVAIGVPSFDEDGHALGAGLVTGQVVEDIGGKALVLGPAQVHPHEHVHPVLGLGAAGAGMDGEDGVVGIVLTGEHALQLHLVDTLPQLIQAGDHLVETLLVVLLHGHVEEHPGILQLAIGLFPGLDDLLGLPQLLLHLLGPGLIVPEIRPQGLLFEPLNQLPLAIQVKDAPSGPASDP